MKDFSQYYIRLQYVGLGETISACIESTPFASFKRGQCTLCDFFMKRYNISFLFYLLLSSYIRTTRRTGFDFICGRTKQRVDHDYLECVMYLYSF